MPKVSSRKRKQREDAQAQTGVVLGDVRRGDVAEKDDEERALESALFGVPNPSTTQQKRRTREDEAMEDIDDSALFFVDDGDATVSVPAPNLADGSRHRRKKAAWVDEDDEKLSVNIKDNKRLRKLREDVEEDVIEGAAYENRLRKQYEKLNPTPNWLSKARERKREHDVDADPDADPLSSLTSSTTGILSTTRPSSLPSGTLDITRHRDANLSSPSSGTIHSALFHPSPAVPVLLTTSSDKRTRLYTIDGHTNPHLQTLHISDLAQPTAVFHPTGRTAYITGMRPFFYSFDLESGSVGKSHRLDADGAGIRSTLVSALSADGAVLAFAGGSGVVQLVDARVRQPVAVLKSNSPLADIAFSGDNEMVGLGMDSEVCVWDVRARRCCGRWRDVDGFGGALVSAGEGVLATGSSTGYVNLYAPTPSSAPSFSTTPQHLKTLSHLTTRITTLSFNADAKLLAVASSAKTDALKIVHVQSGSVFANWPTSGTPVGVVGCVGWSPGGEWLVVGNGKGRVGLWSVGWYAGKGR